LLRKLKFILILTIIFSMFTLSRYFIVAGPALYPGNYGEEVKSLQQRLKNWEYYDGTADGFYDLDTFLAVRRFQECYGLYPSGIADSDTLAAIGLRKYVKAGTAYAQGTQISNEQLLARAINGEARGEPYEGQVAVGAVILNRTRDPKFPNTIAGVIYQPGAFTAVSDGQINVPIDPNSTVVKAARDALNGWDPTNGCLYYWNPATATSKWIWSRKIITKIGKHNFGI